MSEKLLLQEALLALQEKNAKIAAYEKEKTEPIAIIGMACKFPGGADSPSAFWELLKNEIDATGQVPEERWDLSKYEGVSHQDFVPYAALLEKVDEFDAQFFKISSREAKSMDPQHRLLMEISYEALEDAGSLHLQKKADTGVFVGITQSEYGTLLTHSTSTEQMDSFFSTGNLLNAAAGRISYSFGFNGPCMAVDTACSSSLVSVHLACQSLRNQECEQALAGGVNLLLTPYGSIATTKSKMLAPDGKCKVFDQSADGYVRGEGCGMIVLKRLSDAIKDGDNIQALIRSSGISQDGASSGLTVPNGPGQKKLIERVLERAGLSPTDISYVEAHGTGTSLGDPIEFGALNNVFANSHDSENPLHIGAVKSNIGHLESAAGIAGLIKVILSLKHQQIPANLHFKQPSSHIDWKNASLSVVDSPILWDSNGKKRIAGISAFGFSGTNAHVIVQEADTALVPNKELINDEQKAQVLCLSAKSRKALRALTSKYLVFIEEKPDVLLESICYTANACREHFVHRTAITATSTEQLQQKLKDFIIKADEELGGEGLELETAKPRVAFLFSGQGAQYVDMCKSLFETEPTFRSSLLLCQEILDQYLNMPLLDIIYPKEKGSTRLDETRYTQPALFAVNYALAKMWQSWGVHPKVVMGHSVGEYVAACIAGILTLEDALKLIVVRGECLQSMPENGRMLAVFMEEQEVRKLIEKDFQQLSLAAINGPRHVVISGDGVVLERVATALKDRKITTKWLKSNRAFHSPATIAVLSDFEKVANTINFQTKEIDVVSNVTGALAKNEMSTAAYWVRQIHNTVQFESGIHTLAREGLDVFLEISPSTALTSMSRSIKPAKGILYLSTVSADRKEWNGVLKSISKLYTRGGTFNWERFYKNEHRQKMSLPTYPFQRKPHWFDYEDKLLKNTMKNGSAFTKKNKTLKISDITNIKSTLVDIISGLLEENPSDISTKSPLLEMGADSIVLMEAGKKIEERFGLEISMRQFFDELKDIDSLATYIDAHVIPIAQVPNSSQAPVMNNNGTLNNAVRTEGNVQEITSMPLAGLDALVAQQLELNAKLITMLSINKQVISENDASNTRATGLKKYIHKNLKPSRTDIIDPLATFRTKDAQKTEENGFSLEERRNQGLNEQQQDHLSMLTREINERTGKSKEFAAKGRLHHADNRASAGFRFTTKEMLYPIVGQRSQGSKIWDLDGNEYLDISMGFGVNLFGHNPEFIKKAIADQLELGMHLGPQSALSATVANRIAEMTGVERVAFCNSGTEGVMTAMRLARTATGKRIIALFTGAYHGHFDGVLGAAKVLNENPESISVIPGVTHNSINDTIVLDYGNPVSLNLLEKYKHELAGILVEPVQSRRPNLQPIEFLKALRAFTNDNGLPLIFDEVITGFRIHSGGAQSHFNIKADIVVYGKIIGGGMPIGVVAGDAIYLDGLDGGSWNYSDTSYPKVETTFFAGTFCKHPLAMAAALAVLDELQDKGPQLQEDLNQKTASLAAQLNEFFKQKSLAIEIVNFGSLFRFYSKGNIDMLFYNLLARGIYVWEGRNFFLSTAHTDEDIQFLIEKVKESITVMEPSGFLDGLRQKQTTAENNSSNLMAGINTTAATAVPFSQPQQQLWILSQMDKEGWIAYNIPSNLLLEGPLEIKQVDQVLHLLSKRHDTLRTRIDGTTNTMQIAPEVSAKCNWVDLSQHPPEEIDKHLEAWNLEESRIPFSMNGDLFYRFNLIKLAENRHILSLTVHHILFDGWSVIVILKELAEIYSQLYMGISPSLPSAMQFKELIALRDGSDKIKKQSAENYWLDKFSDSIPTLNLPLDFPRPTMKTYNGGRYHELFDKDLIDQLKQLGQKHQCTLFVTLLAAYTLLLKKLSGQNNFVIGIPSSGRSLKRSETVVGYCSQLLPIDSHFSEKMSFSEHLKQTRNLLFEGFEQEGFSFAELIEKLKEKENIMDNPLARATFNMDPMDPFPAMDGLSVSFSPTPLSYVAYDLTLNIIELVDGFKAEWNYNVDIFDATTIHRFSAFFKELLQQLLQAPEQEIALFSLLSHKEEQQLLNKWQDNISAFKDVKTIHQLFEKQAEITPGHEAILQGTSSLDYRSLNERANQWCHFLKKQGLDEKKKVGVLLDKSAETVAVLLGVMKTGAVFVSIDTSLPKFKMDHVLQEVQPELLICKAALLEGYETQKQKIIDIDEVLDTVLEMSAKNPPLSISPDKVAYIVYTSGSTGKPKGIMATHQGVINYLKYLHDVLKLNDKDVVLQLAPLGFDAAIRDIMGPLTAGAKIVFTPDSRDFAQLSSDLQQYSITCLLSTVPSLLSGLTTEIKNKEQVKTALRMILVSGEVLTTQVARQVLDTFDQISLYNQYGPTECTMTSTYYPVHLNDKNTLHDTQPIGRPIPNAEVYIIDNRQFVPEGIVGEICIGGIGLAKGYLNQKALTDEKFKTHTIGANKKKYLYKTGDLGRFNRVGELEFFGRKDNQLKIRGFRVELNEVEISILKFQGIKSCAVIPIEEEDGKMSLHAYLSSEEEDMTVNGLLDFLRKYLPEYALPSKFILLKSLPLTVNGKIDRRALHNKGSEVKSGAKQSVPVNEIEESLLQLWGQVLQKKGISTRDEFFNIGGNSLKAIQLIGRINKEHRKLLTVADIFANQTIQKLALVLESITQKEDTAIVAVPIKESYDLSHAQRRLWLLDQFEENQIVYNISGMVPYDERLDMAAFHLAFEGLVRRHESLRTIFITEEDIPKQKILTWEEMDFKVQYMDLSHLKKPQQQRKITKERKEQPFVLDQGPLLRVKLIKLGETKYLILCSTHHIVADGWSMNVMINEVLTRYHAFEKKEKDPIPPLNIHFKDYAVWHNQLLHGTQLDKYKAFWEQYFEGTLEELELPLDKKRPTQPSFNGGVIEFVLPESLTDKINALCKDSNTTLFTALLTMVKLLLYRYSGQDDIIVGIPIACRDRKELEDQIGFYINTTAFRTRFNADDTMRQLLLKTGENMQKVQEYALYPFNLLMEDLEKRGNLAGNTLFNVMIQIQDTHQSLVQVDSVSQIRETIIDTNTDISKFDLTFNFTLLDNGLTIPVGIEYNTDLFFKDTIEKLRDDFLFMIDKVTTDENLSISSQNIVPLNEKADLLDDFLKPIDEF